MFLCNGKEYNYRSYLTRFTNDIYKWSEWHISCIWRHAQPSTTDNSKACLTFNWWTVPGTSTSRLYAVWGLAGDQEYLHKCVQHPPSFQYAIKYRHPNKLTLYKTSLFNICNMSVDVLMSHCAKTALSYFSAREGL